MRYTHYKFQLPKEKLIRVIIDTDAKNEADDQFAIVHAMLSPKLDIRGFIAAHYGMRDEHGMEKSYSELENFFSVMGFEKNGQIYHGAPHALPSQSEPVRSEGAELIVREAMADDPAPLYVLFLGPLTDLASAYMIEPSIAGRLTAIWIGGGSYPKGGQEFNLGNDLIAANIIMRCPIDIWQVPKNVYEMMPVSMAELEDRVLPCGSIGNYLFSQLEEYSRTDAAVKNHFRTGESWVLGDSPAVGLLLYEHRFEYELLPAPMILEDMSYAEPADDHTINHSSPRLIRVYKRIDSRLILEDMYAKLRLFAKRAHKK